MNYYFSGNKNIVLRFVVGMDAHIVLRKQTLGNKKPKKFFGCSHLFVYGNLHFNDFLFAFFAFFLTNLLHKKVRGNLKNQNLLYTYFLFGLRDGSLPSRSHDSYEFICYQNNKRLKNNNMR